MSDTLNLVMKHGGVVVVPIAILSVAVLAVVIERLWRLWPLRRRFAVVRSACQDHLLTGGAERALAQLDGGDPLSRVLRAGIAVRDRGAERVRQVALDAAQLEMPGLERGLGLLLIATQVAPLLGLLGTVLGLIDAFRDIQQQNAAGAAVVAGGIYHALAATAAGLAVAIPAFIAYSGLNTFIASLAARLEHVATELPQWLEGRS